MAGNTGNAQDGTDATAVTPPAGAEGIRGWLSGIYNRLGGTLTVALSSSSPLDVSDRSARLLGHVTVDNPGGGGTVSVSNFPATQPVSGSVSVSNLPATQAVSGTVAVSNFPATQAVSLATNAPDVTDRAGRLLGHVTVDNLPATQAVSGSVSVSNLPVTQPVSGSVSVSNFPATQPVSGTVGVSGTVPVSLATNTPDVTDRAARLLGHVTVDSAPTTAVTQAALTKGTQGTTGVTTQDLKDAGRTPVVLSVTAVPSIVTETAFTLNIWTGGTATTGTSYTVPAGKTLRLQAVQFGCRFTAPSTTVTFASARFNLRLGNLVTSSLIYGDSKMAASNAPTPNSDLPIPDGLEFPTGTVLSLWHTDSATTLMLDALLVAYLY